MKFRFFRSGAGLACAFVLPLAARPLPASAEVIEARDAGFVVRHVAEVAADPASAWAVLIEPADWWNSAHSFSGDSENFTLDPRAGGCLCEMLPADDDRPAPGSVRHMTVIFVDPASALRLDGPLGPLQSEALNAILTITLKSEDGQTTRIVFDYVVGGFMRYETAQIAPAVDRVIGEQLERLADRIGRPPAEATNELSSPRAELGSGFLDDVENDPAETAGKAVEEADGDGEEPFESR